MLLGSEKLGIDETALLNTAKALINLKNEGYEVAVVIGGGNIFRGINLTKGGIARTPADQMGMLATLINGVALKNAIEGQKTKAHLFSALSCPQVCDSYQYDHALKALEDGNIVIFVGGTSNPYFTTDSAAALRASEMGADLLIKATKVDGVYDKDPKENGAKRYSTLSYTDFLNQKLGVMDLTAVTLCMNNHIPIFVFNMKNLGQRGLKDLLSHQEGTLIKP